RTDVTYIGATISGLRNGTTYYFEATAVGGNGESLKSNEVSATPQAASSSSSGSSGSSSSSSSSGGSSGGGSTSSSSSGSGSSSSGGNSGGGGGGAAGWGLLGGLGVGLAARRRRNAPAPRNGKQR
ncbi:MAG TPA: MYXO-CTERM sorting domain-containing protein, partial [Nevskia sp.]|nr:MYXO-CTERM sorting domain-containing protein [Nevskia sp.]